MVEISTFRSAMPWTLAGGLLIVSVPAHAETYRLVHAVGNEETMIEKGLELSECQARKSALIASGVIVVEGEREDPRLGTLTCLAESFF